MEDDTHDQLVKAYLEYFEANEAWERKNSVRKYYAVHQAVKKIRTLSKKRNIELRQKFLDTKKDRKR